MMFFMKKNTPIDLEYMIVLKEGALDIIKRAKGWKTDAELARNLDFTRQYICSLKKRKTPCTHDVIVRIASILGNIQGNWWSHFEMIKIGKYQRDHQKWNRSKHDGRQPYSKYSVMAEIREKDNSGIEKRQL